MSLARLCIGLILLACLSCKSQNISDESNKTKTPLPPKTRIANDQAMPMIHIKWADKACVSDSDCQLVLTQCSCTCGEGVNKNHADKYSEKRSKVCQGYRGKLCKMRCDGELKCLDKVCVYQR